MINHGNARLVVVDPRTGVCPAELLVTAINHIVTTNSEVRSFPPPPPSLPSLYSCVYVLVCLSKPNDVFLREQSLSLLFDDNHTYNLRVLWLLACVVCSFVRERF